MNKYRFVFAVATFAALAACGESTSPAPAGESPPAASAEPAEGAIREIAPGLSMRILRTGDGETAASGDIAVVHYTGWLYDETAADKRGQKFDSSVDRDQHFRFPLGAGRVISGWDQGVTGMRVGEIRELTIAPELAYGERGAGAVIPPGSTLVFEVELAGIEGQPDPG